MELSEQTKTYLTVCGIAALIIFAIIDLGRSPNYGCNDRATRFKNEFYCNIILTNKVNDAGMATLMGIDIISKKKVATLMGVSG